MRSAIFIGMMRVNVRLGSSAADCAGDPWINWLSNNSRSLPVGLEARWLTTGRNRTRLSPNRDWAEAANLAGKTRRQKSTKRTSLGGAALAASRSARRSSDHETEISSDLHLAVTCRLLRWATITVGRTSLLWNTADSGGVRAGTGGRGPTRDMSPRNTL